MKKCTRGDKCLTAPNTELASSCFETLESGNLRGNCRQCNNGPRMTEKKCSRGIKCKTSPNEMIPISEFELGINGNPKGKCIRCANTSTSPIDSHSKMQQFFTRLLWNADNAAVISSHCEQRQLAI